MERKLEKAITRIRSKKVQIQSEYLILFSLDFDIITTDYFYLFYLNSLRMNSCLPKLSTCRKGYVHSSSSSFIITSSCTLFSWTYEIGYVHIFEPVVSNLWMPSLYLITIYINLHLYAFNSLSYSGVLTDTSLGHSVVKDVMTNSMVHASSKFSKNAVLIYLPIFCVTLRSCTHTEHIKIY